MPEPVEPDPVNAHRLGVIADTHGLLRPQALEALAGCERILHAGDVGRPEVLDALERLAPVTAVRGNVDRSPWAQRLPLTQALPVQGVWLYLLHDLSTLDLDPVAAGIAAVISGHSHRASIAEREGVLYLNPGGAGPQRFGLPVSLAWLIVEPGRVRAELVPL